MTKQRKKIDAPYIHEQLLDFAVDLDLLEIDPANERKHGAANIASIKGSIRNFRVREPIGCVPILDADGRPTGRRRVIRGNGTLTAMRELAAERATGRWDRDAEGNVVETEPLDWNMIPALTFNDPEQVAAAYRVAHNRTSELGTWEWSKLADTLRDLADEFDWTDLGYEKAEFDLLTQADWTPPQIIDDEPEEPRAGVEVQSDEAGEDGILMLKLHGSNAVRMRELADASGCSPAELLVQWIETESGVDE